MTRKNGLVVTHPKHEAMLTTQGKDIVLSVGARLQGSSADPRRIFTTGHSLGAEAGVIAKAFADYDYPNRPDQSMRLGITFFQNGSFSFRSHFLLGEDKETLSTSVEGRTETADADAIAEVIMDRIASDIFAGRPPASMADLDDEDF